VVDSFYERGVRPISVTIHGGSAVTEELADMSCRVQELLNFRVKIDPRTAHDFYEHWREGDHDDLVLATALACWFSEYLRKWEAVA
jgi:hypothetical protein